MIPFLYKQKCPLKYKIAKHANENVGLLTIKNPNQKKWSKFKNRNLI